MLHSCRTALFHCLLFNSSLNSPEFKFELNRFESISKENAKHFSLSPSLFSPAGPIPLLSFFHSFPCSPNRSPFLVPAKTRPKLLFPAQFAPPSSLPPTGGPHLSVAGRKGRGGRLGWAGEREWAGAWRFPGPREKKRKGKGLGRLRRFGPKEAFFFFLLQKIQTNSI